MGATDRHGYARSHGRFLHRVAFEAAKGAIPAGLVIDHLCRVRACLNPDHMEAVARRVNTLRGIGPTARHARQSECQHGHQFDEVNTYTQGGTRRQCRACSRLRARAYQARKRAAA